MITIINGGCNTWHPDSFIMKRPNGISNFVLLIIKTHSSFTLNGTVHEIKPGTAIIIDKNIPYSYYNPIGCYMDDWLHFQTSDHSFYQKFRPIINEFFSLSNVNRFTVYIQQILYENAYTPDKFKQENIDCLFQILMNNLSLAYEEKELFSPSSIYYEKLRELRLMIQQMPEKDYTIKNCSSRLGISTSHFQHLYSKLFHISFQKDLIRMRTDYAANLLLVTNLTVEQIAHHSGYSNPTHFYRQFRERFGITPVKYRLDAR